MRIKHLLILAAFMAMAFTVKAQVSFSCYHREYCDWNEATQNYEDNCRGYDEASLFVMNESETMFTHTTENIKSTYYVKEREYDEENDVWTYNVTSDVGNEYYYIFDPNNKEIRVVIVDDDEDITLLRFYVKAIF